MKVKKFIGILKKDKKLARNIKLASIDGAGLTKYLAYLSSPWRIAFNNLVAGIFYGFGFLIGAAVLVGVIGYFVKNFLVQIPFVGDSIEVIYNWMNAQIDVYKSAQ